MKGITKLLIAAVVANLLTIVLFIYASSEPGGSGLTMAFSVIWMPIVWITCLIVTVVLAVRNHKSLFKKKMTMWTLPVLLFCTPVPLDGLFLLLHYSKIYMASSGYRPANGVTIKDEEWCYTSNQKIAVRKFFKLNSEDYTTAGDSLFKKDSVWTYLSSTGDTIKIEHYKNGKLLFTTFQSNR